ncbi:MAG TPA: lactate utilization protein [Syntrophales bacterium]|nr:lactate utilization protein [Syntrophales bacterium]
MSAWIEQYWQLRLADLKKALEANDFDVYLADNADDVKKIVLEEIIPALKPGVISWGTSMTSMETGLYAALKAGTAWKTIETTDKTISWAENVEKRRQALLVDLFITGTNAVTENGELVNLDGTGNRVASLTFGPKNVIVLASRNKIVADLDDAFKRIKNYTAPVNSIRLNRKTPCVKTSYCEECKSAERICNTWTITEKSAPKGRVKVILINGDFGI